MFLDFKKPPSAVDRVVIHQFDPSRPSPGGIDTCLRGICRYQPIGTSIAIVGVDAGGEVPGRKIGNWERHQLDGQPFWFLPVVKLDPANQSRVVPHSIRLLASAGRHWKKVPTSKMLHVHRMDLAAALKIFSPRPQVYFVHTQENGLTGVTSDSFWRFFGGFHQVLERFVVRRALAVMVFNPDYAKVVGSWNKSSYFFPTWYDPNLVLKAGSHEDEYSIIWVGRLEVPKDPELAVLAFVRLVELDGDNPWKLEILGSGTRQEKVRDLVSSLPKHIGSRVLLRGRVSPQDVANTMGRGGCFLMTSHPGYEGYPRVLVEAMASGLPAIVTHGSDTGGIVKDGVTGFNCSRAVDEIAAGIIKSRGIIRQNVEAAVSGFDAPTLVDKIFELSDF